MSNFQGKTVLVTGASGGIGSLVAEKLAQSGIDIVLLGRDQLALERVQAGIVNNGGKAQVIVADLLQPADRQRIADACSSLPNGLHGLINNAGVNHFAWLEDQTEELLQTQIHLNLVAPILLTRTLLPSLQKTKNAQILNIGSTLGSIGYPGYTAYCASKSGLRGFTEALRRELLGSGICVQYFAPRATRTALNSVTATEMNYALGNAVDLPETVAAAIVEMFLSGTRKQIFWGWPEKLFVHVNALLPSIVDKALAKQLPVIKKHAKDGASY